MARVECLFNAWTNTPDGSVETFGLKPGKDCKKCGRCGQNLSVNLTGPKQDIAAFLSVNRPEGCNGKTHP